MLRSSISSGPAEDPEAYNAFASIASGHSTGMIRPRKKTKSKKNFAIVTLVLGTPLIGLLVSLYGMIAWMKADVSVETLRNSHDVLVGHHNQTFPKKQEHIHTVPNILIFTHNVPLLQDEYAGNFTSELLALRKNIQHTIQLHPTAQVRFLTDKDCIRSIQTIMGPSSSLVHYFEQETHGMYKADICRGAALYETGGLYFDADIGARMPLWEVLKPATTFCTTRVHMQSNHKGSFFQAFIAANPRNPIVYRYLKLFEDFYQGRIQVDGPLGVLLLRRAYDEIRALQRNGDMSTASQVVQIWQEVLWNQELFPDVPKPTWGTRRACRFVVVSNRNFPLVVPFYSRVAGSRMCPENPTADNPEHS